MSEAIPRSPGSVAPRSPTELILRPGVRVDLDLAVIQSGSERARLTQTEVRLLAYLAEREGQDVTTEELHREVWSFAPQVVSRAAFHTVQRLRRKIERDPSAPEHLITVYGVGYRLHLSIPEPDAPSDAGLVGRERERRALLDALGRGRVVALTGAPGVGKTRLATSVLCDRRGLLVDLSGARTSQDLDGAVAAALDLPPGALREQISRALAALGDVLMVLDGADHVWTEVSAALPGWTRAPGPRWLITSCRWPGEPQLRLKPLPVPREDADEDEIAESPAVRLWLARSGGRAADPTAARIVRLLDGVPLAIELAAGRVPLLGVRGVLDRLDAPLTLLRRPGDARHDALSDALQWSWDSLSGAEQQTLAQCAAFRAPFRVEAAEAVVRLPPGSPPLLDVLQTLVDANLLRPLGGTPHRLGMLRVVAAFARQHAEDPELPLRHARFFARAGERSRIPDPISLDEELPDLLAASEVAIAERDAPAALSLAAAIVAVRSRIGPMTEAEAQVDAALALAGAAPEHAGLRRALRLQWATLLCYSQQWTRALGVLEEARAEDGAEGELGRDPDMIAAHALFGEGDLHRADALCSAALERAAAAGDDAGVIEASLLSAYLASHLGRPAAAAAMLERALERSSTPSERCRIHRALGTVHHATGALDRAGAHYELALGACSDNLLAEADVLEMLGTLTADRGDLDAAAALLARAARLWERLGRDSPMLLVNRAHLELERQDVAKAEILASEAERLARAVGANLIRGSALALRGRLALLAHRPDRAAALLGEGRELLAGDPIPWALATAALAEAVATEHPDVSDALLQSAREILTDAPNTALLAHWWCHRGQAAAARGDRTRAREAHRRAAKLAEQGVPARIEREIERLAAALD